VTCNTTLPEALSLSPERLPALFIADLHLTDARPQTLNAFFGFLSGPARQAGSLFILGDLFEYWAGDDDIDSPLNQRVCTALRETGAAGTGIFFMTGNRDLLAGDGFTRAANLQLLADPTPVRFGAQTLLLSHGDALCTDDLAYQDFRRQARDPAWQASFLAQPLAARRAFIEKVRNHSETAKREKRTDIMDVNAEAVASLLRAHRYPALVHGHTHRPGQHSHLVDGNTCERHVLADWQDHPVWLAYDGETFSVHGPGAP
jgi:UDP-2,3-diacylglucosamine hydrolase